ncbi:MAG TPA: hypothetical protein DCG89_01045 [Spartobacteria bacterium]|jgi:hypothetical protein|nr:hypothetical protein [Spartobacteria bacterium]
MFCEPASVFPVPRTKFRLAGGTQPLMLVPMHVNECGPFDFILDTGAGTTLLTPELARTLGVQSTGSKEGQTAGGVVKALLATVDSLAIAVIGALCISVLLSLIATPTVYLLLRGGHTSDNDGDVFHDAPQVIESELIS